MLRHGEERLWSIAVVVAECIVALIAWRRNAPGVGAAV